VVRRFRMPGVSLAAFGAAMFAAGLALGTQQAPTDWRGIKAQVLAKITLAGEIADVKHRDLRLSRVSIAPGGHVPVHSHQGDPTIVYVLSGVLTNRHMDGTVRQYRAGEVFAEFGPRRHWIENAGTEPVVFLDANIHKEK
jgi:quercetin dioxygenase-like cupin family protein